MNIREIHENKKQFLPLLLLADEQEDMIDRYLERGAMYVLEDGGVKAECVITDEGGGILELKNLAVEPEAQRKGYGKALIDFLVRKYAGHYALLQVGTGDSPLTVPFYEKCGFTRSHRIPNFFTDRYDLRGRGAAGGYGVPAKKLMILIVNSAHPELSLS